MRTKLQLVALSLAALCLLSVEMSGCVSTTPATSTYQFTTGTAPPRVVSDLLRHGTAVLLINQYGCPPCDEENPKFADLQAQYKDANVSFATFNIGDNVTSRVVARAYKVNVTPIIFVIREDGAFAKLNGTLSSNGLIDLNTVKSAIDDAQKWQSLNPTATVATPDYSSHYNTIYSTYNVIVTPFSLTTSANGNDLYVGVNRNFSRQSANTITFELCTSEAQAAQIYQKTVTDATNAGYVARATVPSGFSAPAVQAWQGDYGYKYKMVAYYQDPSVGNAWVVETQYA
jgi:thiol-disulfide isomerase/thioredoxin